MTAAALDRDEWAEAEEDGAGPAATGGAAEPTLNFPTLPDFVRHLGTWYRREVFDSYELTWCPDWWRHPEAVVRLEAMWRSLESLRQDGATGISVWLRDHADVHMAQLLSPAGPFRGCTAKDGHAKEPLAPLPVTDPPAGWWARADSGL